MRSVLGLGSSAVAGIAAVIASLDGDADIVPFFVALTFLGGVEAWAACPPFVGRRRLIARSVALVWPLAAVWAGALLLIYTASEGSRPPSVPEATYLGLTATVYHLIGLYGGVVLILSATFAPERWFQRSTFR